MNFAYPLGLAALVAIGIPLLLHRWRTARRIVKLGSIRFLDTLPDVRIRTSQWRERLLLLCRAGLLFALALALGKMEWSRSSREGVRWALREPGVRFSPPVEAAWQSALRAGFLPKLLVAGFPDSARSIASPPASGVVSIWSLLREADARGGGGSQFRAFISGSEGALGRERLPAFRGRWQFYVGEAGPENHFLRRAQISPDGEIALTIETQSAERTGYTELHLPRSRAGDVDLKVIELNPEQTAVRLKDSPGPWTKISAAPVLRILVEAPPARIHDAHALRAAALAVAAKHGWTTSEMASLTGETFRRGDWIFVLEPTAEKLAQARNAAADGASVLTEPLAGMLGSTVSAEMKFSAEISTLGIRVARSVTLTREVTLELKGEKRVLARDSFGHPVLAMALIGRGRFLEYASRFRNDWSDIAEGFALPLYLEGLLCDEVESTEQHDRRRIDPRQFPPGDSAERNFPRVEFPQSLAWIAAFAAMALFFLERGVNFLRRPRPAAAVS